jgi:hypothetical protein
MILLYQDEQQEYNVVAKSEKIEWNNMFEITTIAILLILILMFMMLRSWLPILSNKIFFTNDLTERGMVHISITIRKINEINEEFFITSLGLSKNFKLNVLFEIFGYFDNEENSKFFYGDLKVITYENVKDFIREDKGFITSIMCMDDNVSNQSNIYLICTNESYEFIKNKIKINDLMSMSIDDGMRFDPIGLEKFIVKSRKVKLNFENTFECSNSLERFINRYENNPELLKNIYLKSWLEQYKDFFKDEIQH